jgi:hypothetical protein
MKRARQRIQTMPLDFTSQTTKASALAAYSAACASPDLADWQALAAMLAQHLAPKARAPKAESAGEWCEYTQSQRSGRGGAFHTSRRADFLFADGTVISVSLCHKMTIAAPDWARAARCAVSFYKAKRSAMILRALNNWSWFSEPDADGIRRRCVRHRMDYDGQVDRDAQALSVPEIVDAVDVTRNVTADLAKCNAATIKERNAD